jgi:hypothetical protein
MKIQRFFLLLPIAMACSASAQSVSLDLAAYQTDYTVYVNTQGADDTNQQLYSTVQTLMTSSQSGGLNLPSDIQLFCVELGQGAPTTATPYTLLGGASAISVQGSSDTRGQVDTLAGIGTLGIGSARAANLEFLYGYALSGGYSLLSEYNQAVFQMAVWQLSHSDSFALSTNSTGFYFSSPNVASLVTDTQTLLNDVYSNEATINPVTLDVLHSDTAQDYLLPVDSNGNLIAIPEPSAWAALIGLSSLGYALLRRRAASAA